METGPRLAQYSAGIQKFFGRGNSIISIVTSTLLAVISVFYVYTLGTHLPVVVYFFLTRFTYIKPFNDYIVTRYFDSIIIGILTLAWLILSLNGKLTKVYVSAIFGSLLATVIIFDLPGLRSIMELSTLPLISFFMLYQTRKRYQNQDIVRNNNFSLSLSYLAIIAIAMGIFSISISLSVILTSQTFSVENIYMTKRIPVDNYGYEIFIFFSILSPLLLIVIFFGFPLKMLVNTIFRKIIRFNKSRWLRPHELPSSEEPHRKRSPIFYLALFVLFSMLLAMIPQLPSVNRDNQQIGSDSESYAEWVTLLRQTSMLQDFFKTTFVELKQGDRPLSIIFPLLFAWIIDAPVLDAIEYIPVILGPLLVIVVYLFTRELTSNITASLFAASLTGLGFFQVSVGIYAGFYANWIALLVGYSSLIFFFRYLRTPRKITLLIFFTLLLAMLFSHAYTWTVFTIVMGLYLVVSIYFKSYNRKDIVLLLILLISSVAIDVAKTMLLESFGTSGGVKLTLALAQASIELKDPGLIWNTLVDATQHHFGGIFSNFIVLGLVVYWLFRSNLRRDFNIFMVVFLMIGIPPFFFGDWIVQSRVYYNIPFQIPAAIALTYISRQKTAPRILVPMYIWLIAVSLWTVSNFYEVIPS